MKHYNDDAYCCYPRNNEMEMCKNCARYLENKRDGEYIVVDYRASGRVFISTLENGEQSADVYSDCHEGNEYMMYEVFEDGEPEPEVEEVVEASPIEEKVEDSTEEVVEEN